MRKLMHASYLGMIASIAGTIFFASFTSFLSVQGWRVFIIGAFCYAVCFYTAVNSEN